MADLRQKSIKLTAYLEHLLLKDTTKETCLFEIITPSDPHVRGAQLSILLKPGLLHTVSDRLQNAGIICDKREPGVVRVAPTPLYNTFSEVFKFVEEFKGALSSL
jgi:kynureninase